MSDPELSELLQRRFAGELDEAGAGRLLDRCRRDPEAARALAELTRVERALAWRYADRGGEAFLNEVLMRLGPERGRPSGFVRAVIGRVESRPRSPLRRFPLAAAAILLVAAGAVAAWWLIGAPASLGASIAASQGQVRLLRGAERLPAAPGLDIVVGDGLQTGADGQADVRYGDGTNVRLFAGTEARFAPRRVELKAGSLRCDAAPQVAGRTFVVTTPHAEAAVLGTSFELTATREETRLRAIEGRVRFTAAGESVEVRDGGLSTANARGLRAWEPVCDLDFSAMTSLPDRIETVFCNTTVLHTPDRKVVPAAGRTRLENGGLWFVMPPEDATRYGLIVARLKEEVGDDAVVEATIAGGAPWTLGMAVSGDSFEGYRVIFVSSRDKSGISVDSIWPVEVAVLAQDPRTISFERDRLLRVEKLGRRIRVWVDRELRVDTEVSYPLPEKRLKTVALSNFGGPPIVRNLRVWRRPAP